VTFIYNQYLALIVNYFMIDDILLINISEIY